jgi:class 3 adenylate cyclase
MPLARLPVLWLLTSTPRRSAHAVTKRALRWVSRALAFMPGAAIVGNFGGGRFFDYTAYGDTINVAARLEAANKQLGTRICAIARLHRFCVCAERLGRRRELDAKFL